MSALEVTDWAAIDGKWKFESGVASYEGSEGPPWLFGLCVSKIRFLEGEAQATVIFNEPNSQIDARIVLGYRPLEGSYFLVGLGGYGRAYTISHFSPASGWRELASTGSIDNLRPGRSYVIRVLARGQRVILEVDDIRVLEYVLPMPLPYGQFGLFAWGNKRADFKDVSVRAERGDVFVVMQFSDFEELYTDVIVPIVKQFGLWPYRADEVFGPGSIIRDVERGIELAQIVIAEITPANENVFYEVGYAHALRKPTILLVNESKPKLPFDLSGYRCLFYQNSIGGKRKVEDGLKKHLQSILNE